MENIKTHFKYHLPKINPRLPEIIKRKQKRYEIFTSQIKEEIRVLKNFRDGFQSHSPALCQRVERFYQNNMKHLTDHLFKLETRMNEKYDTYNPARVTPISDVERWLNIGIAIKETYTKYNEKGNPYYHSVYAYQGYYIDMLKHLVYNDGLVLNHEKLFPRMTRILKELHLREKELTEYKSKFKIKTEESVNRIYPTQVRKVETLFAKFSDLSEFFEAKGLKDFLNKQYSKSESAKKYVVICKLIHDYKLKITKYDESLLDLINMNGDSAEFNEIVTNIKDRVNNLILY